MATPLFLGESVDPAKHERTGDRIEYDPADLTTHGVIVGMTGSGKTGLGVVLLEEALRGGHPHARHRPQGRHDQHGAAVSRSERRRVRALGARGRRRRRHGDDVVRGPGVVGARRLPRRRTRQQLEGHRLHPRFLGRRPPEHHRLAGRPGHRRHRGDERRDRGAGQRSALDGRHRPPTRSLRPSTSCCRT